MGCHLSIFSPESQSCHGLTCSRKELCKLVENQLISFAGHRVDKRSLDDDGDGEVTSGDGDDDGDGEVNSGGEC